MTDELELFCEDVDEQLGFMEDALIQMQEDGVDMEAIGALFRAMHTIKGTAGMFGFDEVVSFAHVAESLLSEVREEKVTLTEDMIDTFLHVKDHTQKLIDLAIAHESMDEETKQKNDSLLSTLKTFMPGAKVQKSSVKVEEQSRNLDEEESSEALWHISIRLSPRFFSTGMDIINIISFFNMLGKIEKLIPITCNVPNLEDLNPLEAYVGFEIKFLSESTYADIEEIFEFVVDDVDVHIFRSNDVDMLKALVDYSKDKESLKDTLIKNGFYSESDFELKVVEEVVKEVVEPKIETPTKEVKKTKESEKPTVAKSNKKDTTHKNFSLRVDSSKIDHLINQISEMVIANAKIYQRADVLDDSDLSESATIMSDMLEDIRSGVMNIRMVQVGDSFNKFKRIVNDTSKKIGKEVNFSIVGGETELDKMVVEKISDPLMHMLRNSIDHGVEMPDEREAKGKARQGNVTLSTYPDAGTIVIEVRDDGKGLPRDTILQKAINSGLVKESDNLSDKEIYNLIFAAGLSTAEKVSDISGRGVGMDVVKRNIEDLRGTVEINSAPEEGSLFTIRLPLTLAIIDGFLVQSGDTKYIIPLEMIQECIELDDNFKKHMNGNEFINLRDSILPLLDIRDYFNEAESKTQRENVLVVKYGDYKMGMMVDELFGEFQTVIKPLGEVFKNAPGLSGGTILGSGEIALIFDIPKLMEYKIRKVS
ncbi:MAG: chemotaxis protein CheA [Campylobacterota bacterium]|nr:chemotaxis protein CheA [Campylobacterota bacterium]